MFLLLTSTTSLPFYTYFCFLLVARGKLAFSLG
uniref:Uncharacterized protein n=1 Tax=Arundo donax TaxID=35708 RepID=A0A0A9FLN7_ARUDO